MAGNPRNSQQTIEITPREPLADRLPVQTRWPRRGPYLEMSVRADENISPESADFLEAPGYACHSLH